MASTQTNRSFALSAKRQALIASLLEKEGVSAPVSRIPRRAQASDPAPLSYAQRRLWLLDRITPGNPVYNVPACFRLRGALDVDVLARALEEVVRRHEVLRTTFTAELGEPAQVVAGSLTVKPTFIDLRTVPGPGREAEAKRLAVEEARRPFDLQTGPLLRMAVFQLAEDDHLVLLAMHHIVSDAWSMGILAGELTDLYAAFRAGRPSPLPELPVQYGDFALWQRDWLRTGVLDQQLAYWKRRLEGAPAVLELPSNRPRPAAATFRGATVSRVLPISLLRSLEELGERANATLFMTLLAGFFTLLHRYTGQQDLVIGSPIANRNRAETEKLIGFFPNTLVLRADLSGDPPFRELLGRVRETALGAYSNQDVPFEKIIEATGAERSANRMPLFQVAFLLQNAPMPEARLPGLEISPVDLDIGTAKCDLSLAASTTRDGLNVAFEYSTDLFEAAGIGRMLDHLETLLAGIAADPGRRLSELPLLSAAERSRILVDWNRTARPFSESACAHHLFEQQAARAPDAPALLWGAEAISYAELNRRANRLAHRLVRLGVGPEVLVAIALDRSPAMIAALLGVLKAGAAYLPLATDQPADRIAFLLEDARPRVLIAGQPFHSRLPEAASHLLWLDADNPALARESDTNPVSAAGPDSLAYVIYTSGSTGRPKGVLIEHRGLCNLAAAQRELFDAGPGSRVLQFAAPTFDASVWEVFMALANGGTLCLGDGRPLLGDELARVLRAQRVTVATLPPSVLATMSPERFPDLAMVISAGESCTDETVRHWGWKRRFFNAYGPTETTVCATVAEGATHIGRPIANTRVYILDRSMQPVPAGVAGEIHVGGVGLARGYLNRPELAASRFVPDPFGEPGARLYKTGDLGRYRPDGEIEFLGRLDDQVKIRGFRIEPAEIESRLAEHPAVLQSLVLAREDTPGQKRLVAYVVPRHHAPSAAELRTFLADRLPSYMVPSAFVVMNALPLNPSGKVDRRALPPPALEPDRPRVEPRDSLEQQLARIWEELLGVSPVGAADNFFDLGGDSLVAVHVAARIRELTGREIPVSSLFEAPTVERLAILLRRAGEPERSPLVPIQPGGSQPPLFLVHPAGGNVLCYADLARALGPGQPVYGLEGRPAEERLAESIEQMAARYVAAVRQAQPEGPYRLGGLSSGGLVAFEMAQQLRRQGEQVSVLALLDTWAPQDLPQPDEAELLASVAASQARMHGVRLKLRPKQLRRLPPRHRLPFVVARLVAAGLLPREGAERQIRRVLETYRANARAAAAYSPAPYPERVTLFRASGSRGSRDLGWSAYCSNLEILKVPGDHQSFIAQPRVRALARNLSALVSRPGELSRPDNLENLDWSDTRMNTNQNPKKPTAGMPAFLAIWLGQLVSLLGSGLTGFALGLWALRSTGSVTPFALISACTVLPRILLSPLAGALVDRWDRRWTMIASEAVSALSTAGMAVLLLNGRLEIWHIYAGMSLISAATAFQWPAYSAATTLLVPKEKLGNASGMVQIAHGLAQTMAPLMAGVLVETSSVRIHGVLLIDFGTYLFAIATLALIRIPKAREASMERQRSSVMADIAYGWTYLAQRRGLLGLLVFLAASNFLLGTIMILVNPLVLSFASPKVLGTVMTTAGAGMFVGSAAMSVWGGPKRRIRGVLGFLLLGGVALLPTGLPPSAPLIATGAFFFLLGIPIVSGCTQAILQSKVATGVQGRIFAVTGMVAASSMPLAYVTAGPLADRVFEPLLAVGGPLAGTLGHVIGVGPGRGVALAFMVAGALMAALAVAGWLYPRLRLIEDELPDAVADGAPAEASSPDARRLEPDAAVAFTA